MVPISDTGQHGCSLIDQDDIPISTVNSDTKPWQLWLWFNDWLDENPQESLDWNGCEFAMEVGLGGVAGNFASHVKPVFDGVISAFHAATALPPEITVRVSAQVKRDEETVQRWLMRKGLIRISEKLPVHLRGAGVQWSPDDHLCTHGVLRPLTTASRTMQLRIWSTETP